MTAFGAHRSADGARRARNAKIRSLAVLDPLSGRCEQVLRWVTVAAASFALLMTGVLVGPVIAVLAVVPALVAGFRRTAFAALAALAMLAVTVPAAALHPTITHGPLPELPGMNGVPARAQDQLVLVLALLAVCLGALTVQRRQAEMGPMSVLRAIGLVAAGGGLGAVVVLASVPVGDTEYAPLPWWVLPLLVVAAANPLDLSRSWRMAVPAAVAALVGLVALVARAANPSGWVWTVSSAVIVVGLLLFGAGTAVFAVVGSRLPRGVD